MIMRIDNSPTVYYIKTLHNIYLHPTCVEWWNSYKSMCTLTGKSKETKSNGITTKGIKTQSLILPV